MASDVLVSARIPQGKKEASKKVLSSLGITASELINSAFDYVLEKGDIPRVQPAEKPTLGQFEQFLEESSIPVDWKGDAPDGDYRQMIRQGKLDSYESIA